MATTPSKTASVITKSTVPFFYVSDLVDVIVSSIAENLVYQQSSVNGIPGITNATVKEEEKARLARTAKEFSKLRVILGPVEITNPKDASQSRYVSLGDIPISVKYFVQWLTDKMLKRANVEYTLSNFLNAFLNELVRDFLGNDDCFNGSLRQSVRLSQAAITSYKNENSPYDEITDLMRHSGDARVSTKDIPSLLKRAGRELPVLNIAGSRSFANDPRPVPEGGGLERETNYLTYYAGRIMPAERATGDKTIDEEQGIYHYGIGRKEGIVKTINFRKTSAVGLKELRFEQQGYDGLQQLREQYDVEVKTFANVAAFPGVYIYVEPETIAPNYNGDLTQLGVGGYHMIIRSEHSFGAGLAETTITAKWVAEKYSGADPQNLGQPDPKKCKGRGSS
jgi:hypothetical protein